VGACGPDSIWLTKDSILDRCYEIWSDYRQNGPIHQVVGAGKGAVVGEETATLPPALEDCLDDADENMPLKEV
jgi:hypothetical protein